MSKYEPLRRHLERISNNHVPMRFKEIEAILGFELPPSSRRHRAWWSNNPSNNVMTNAWLDAGFETEAVDLEQGHLIFRRTRSEGTSGAADSRKSEPSRRKTARHPILGCMKGTVTLAPDLDLAAPADADWGRIAYGDDG